MSNECTPLYRPGQEVTALTTAAVTGSTFVGISATRLAGMIRVATATQAVKPFGVASADIASGATGNIIRGGIVFVTAGGAITAGAEVEVGASGKVVTKASGTVVGTALETGSNGNPVLVALDI
ncbi:DUF2190 family protein [Mycolicibacterium phocaicum]|uniref:Uncharacterized protein n=1 Tax=Mycolicibacterium phocaicum TaxID=319706 RepID=A0A7I7ZSJ2_9MYCO|nr:DUF2190 family protein [Mycolicibacterium phocaicum]TLH61004.1 hypothetical protein C1S79_25785 [Mycolicibacterium phocaicum]BBZ57070.1 hypothetical protein MPHO_40620 [Mycolicibacterium phocaicum]